MSNKELRQTFTKKNPELASLISVGRVSITDIQNRLKNDEVLLEYYGYQENIYAFVVTKTNINSVKLNGHILAKAVSEFRNDIVNIKHNHYKTSSQKLYNRLIKPVEKFMIGKQLTIVPHASLHYLPFSALNNGQKYLIDQFDIRLLPSASILQFIDDEPLNSQGLLALGNPDLNDANYSGSQF